MSESWSLSDQLKWSRAAYVHDDWSVAKPREECKPFEYVIASTDLSPHIPRDRQDLKARETVAAKIEKELARKRKPKYPPDNVSAFLKIRFPKGLAS